MSLDYPNTCPDIDKNIANARDVIRDHLLDILGECVPIFKGEERDSYLDDCTNTIYVALEDCFEEVRSTNEDMRKQADTQIEAMEQEIDELKSQVDSLQDEVDNFEVSN